MDAFSRDNYAIFPYTPRGHWKSQCLFYETPPNPTPVWLLSALSTCQPGCWIQSILCVRDYPLKSIDIKHWGSDTIAKNMTWVVSSPLPSPLPHYTNNPLLQRTPATQPNKKCQKLCFLSTPQQQQKTGKKHTNTRCVLQNFKTEPTSLPTKNANIPLENRQNHGTSRDVAIPLKKKVTLVSWRSSKHLKKGGKQGDERK